MSIEVNAGVILTERGKQLIEAANATGRDIQLTQFGVGDGGVSGGKGAYNPTLEELRALTSVSGEFDKRNLQGATPLEGGGYVVEGNVPSDVGLGRWVRLFGLYTTDNELMYVFLFPEWEKPAQTGGMNLEIPFRATIGVGDVSNITIKIDPSIVTASQQFVLEKIKAHQADEHAHSQYALSAVHYITDDPKTHHVVLKTLNVFLAPVEISLPVMREKEWFLSMVHSAVDLSAAECAYLPPVNEQINHNGTQVPKVWFTKTNQEFRFIKINGELSV